MSPQHAALLADAILLIHTLAAAFIVFGLVVIPLGARRWGWVRSFWWRLLHLLAFTVVVIQKWWGETCFLTVWERHLQTLARQETHPMPLVHAWDVIHVDLPLWPVIALYSALWLWTLVLWRRVPPAFPKYKAPNARSVQGS